VVGGTHTNPPTEYSRPFYHYEVVYVRTEPFKFPKDIEDYEKESFREASEVFRKHDVNHTGELTFDEWKSAMHDLNYTMSDDDAVRLFRLIDTNNDQKVDEREFCDYWNHVTHPSKGHHHTQHKEKRQKGIFQTLKEKLTGHSD